MDGLPLAQFEARSQLKFRDKALLRTAFVHSSYGNEAPDDEGEIVDNERLEFLGDSVLGFVVAEYLYEKFPALKEGQLTTLRAALVRREALAHLAKQMDLGDYLLLGHGEDESGGRQRMATLCATYEALVGALFLDQGLDAVRAAMLPMMAQQLEAIKRQALNKDAKSRLQEWSQAALGAAPRYRVLETRGPDHAKEFVIEVTILSVRCGVGRGWSKQEASTLAASQALVNLELSAPEPDAIGDDGTEGETAELAARWPTSDDVLAQLQAAASAATGAAA